MTFDIHSHFADEDTDQSWSNVLKASSIEAKIKTQNKHPGANLCLLSNRKIQV